MGKVACVRSWIECDDDGVAIDLILSFEKTTIVIEFLVQRFGLKADELMNVDSFIDVRTYAESGSSECLLYGLEQPPYQLDDIAKTADPALVTNLFGAHGSFGDV